MKQLLKDYLIFSKSERNGIIVLLIIMFILIGIMSFFNVNESSIPEIDFSEFEQEVSDFERQFTSSNLTPSNTNRNKPSHLTLFPFNPNSTKKEDWKRLGLSNKVINTIQKFVRNGGEFRTKQDFKRIYGITENDYQRLEPFMVIPKKEKKKKEDVQPPPEKKLLVALNVSNERELQEIQGVGPVFSKRIVQYRELLGGYYKIDQIKEVYGIDQDAFEEISSQLTLTDTLLKKININLCDAKKLMTHPYINDWNLANAIINYRKTHGPYSSVSSLKNIHLVKEQWLHQIQPYLTAK